MKKSIIIGLLPLAMILASCRSKPSSTTPAGPTGHTPDPSVTTPSKTPTPSAVVVEDFLKQGKQEDIIFSNDSKLTLDVANKANVISNAYNNSKGILFDGAVKNLNLTLDGSAYHYSDGDQASGLLKLSNLNGGFKAGVTGYTTGKEMLASDLKVFANLEGLKGGLSGKYHLPNAAKESNFPMKQDGNFDLKLNDVDVRSSILNSNLYVDLSDAGLLNLANSIKALSFIDFSTILGENVDNLSGEELLKKYNLTKFAINELFPEGGLAMLPSVVNFGQYVNQYYTEIVNGNTEESAQIRQYIQMYMNALNVKTYTYGNTSKYDYAVSAQFDDANAFYKGMSTLTGTGTASELKSAFEEIGINIKNLSIKLGLAVLKDGSIELYEKHSVGGYWDIARTYHTSSEASYDLSIDFGAEIGANLSFLSNNSSILKELVKDPENYTVIYTVEHNKPQPKPQGQISYEEFMDIAYSYRDPDYTSLYTVTEIVKGDDSPTVSNDSFYRVNADWIDEEGEYFNISMYKATNVDIFTSQADQFLDYGTKEVRYFYDGRLFINLNVDVEQNYENTTLIMHISVDLYYNEYGYAEFGHAYAANFTTDGTVDNKTESQIKFSWGFEEPPYIPTQPVDPTVPVDPTEPQDEISFEEFVEIANSLDNPGYTSVHMYTYDQESSSTPYSTEDAYYLQNGKWINENGHEDDISSYAAVNAAIFINRVGLGSYVSEVHYAYDGRLSLYIYINNEDSTTAWTLSFKVHYNEYGYIDYASIYEKVSPKNGTEESYYISEAKFAWGYEDAPVTPTPTEPEPTVAPTLKNCTIDLDAGDYGWTVDESGVYTSTNQGISNSSAVMTITCNANGSLAFDYRVDGESGCDVLMIQKNNEYIVSDPSDAFNYTYLYIDVEEGDVITITYRKDGSIDHGEDCAQIKNLAFYNAQ